MMFFPDKQIYFTPKTFDLDYEDVFIETTDRQRLHAWLVPAKGQAKGWILFLHGNAENISTHFANVSWLPHQGYTILALDYRGYGRSTGRPDVQGALKDIRAAHHWLSDKIPDHQPFFLLGQSMGAALALSYAGNLSPSDRLRPFDGIISDASFASYPGIAREVLASYWLTWPVQWVSYLVIASSDDPEERIGRINAPLLLIHSRSDHVIRYHHAEQLVARASPHTRLVSTRTAHTATFNQAKNRKMVMEFLQSCSNAGLE